MKNYFPLQLENIKNIIKRAIEGKSYLKQFIETSKPTGKVYLVGHSRYLESFIASKYEND